MVSVDGTPSRALVLLAACNGAAFLPAQMQSLLWQQEVDVRILISLDPSVDSSEELISKWMARYSQIKILEPLPASGGAAQNFFRLLRDADFGEADFVCFSDQDDIWLSDRLSVAISRIREQGVDAYSSDVIAFWPDGRTQLIKKSQPQRRWDHWFEAAGPGCSYVFTRRLADMLKGFVRRQWWALQGVALHDWLCYAYARHNGFGWFIDSYPGIKYRQHARNELGANSGWPAIVRRFHMIRRGWLFEQSTRIGVALDAERSEQLKRLFRSRRMDRLLLAWIANDCRRRFRDQWLFRATCLYSFLTGVTR